MTAPTGGGCGRVHQITRRQRDIWTRIIAGMSNKEIARDLDLGVGTVKIHVASLYRNLGVKNRAAAAAAGLRMLTEQRQTLAAPSTQFAKNYVVRYQYDLGLERGYPGREANHVGAFTTQIQSTVLLG
jgi:DNA-binding CsgD family transcriptional regulator